METSKIKQLREITGVGILDCKKALGKVDGDIDSAIEWLRTNGMAKAVSKSDRDTSQGLVAVHTEGSKAVVIELNCETDFVARNENFQNLARNIVEISINYSNIEQLKQAVMASGHTVESEINQNIATIGENISLRSMHQVTINNGAIGGYVHNVVAENLGSIAGLVSLECDSVNNEVNLLAKQLSMHVVASKPQFLKIIDIPENLIEKEKNIISQQTNAPEKFKEKAIESQLKKWKESMALEEQSFVMDNKVKISDLLKQCSNKIGKDIKIKEFVRFELGQS